MSYEDEKEEIEKEIEEESESFRHLSASLGSLMFSSSVLKEESGALRAALSDIRKRKDEENRNLLIMKETVSSYEERKERKDALDREIESGVEEIRALSIRLGAAIYEQCSFSIPDKAIFACAYKDLEEENKLSSQSSPFLRIINHGKAAIRRIGRDSRYSAYADAAISSDTPLEGNALSLRNEIIEKGKKLEEMKGERNALLSSLESDSDSYKEMVHSSIAAATAEIEKLEEEELDASSRLGSFFFDNGERWIDENTAPEALDSVENLLASSKRLDELKREKERIERDAKRDEYLALIESEEAKIRVLEEDKARLDAEIDGIRGEIERLKREIDKLGGSDAL